MNGKTFVVVAILLVLTGILSARILIVNREVGPLLVGNETESRSSHQTPSPKPVGVENDQPKQSVEIPVKYLDNASEFEGVAPYQNITLSELPPERYSPRKDPFVEKGVKSGIAEVGKAYASVRITEEASELLWAVINSLDRSEFELEYVDSDYFVGNITSDGLERLRNISYVEGVWNVEKATFDSTLTLAKSVIRADTDVLHMLGTGLVGGNFSVCIIDTGVDVDNLDFSGRILAQRCFCSSSGGCCPNGQTTDSNASDDRGHGTWVTGVLAANYYNVGIAPNASIVPIKVASIIDNGTEEDARKAIEWCVNNKDNYSIAAISISGSWGTESGTCASSLMTSAIQGAVAAGIPVLAATGNAGSTSQIGEPACVANATAVAASLTSSDTIWSDSNRNNLTAAVAPGSLIQTSELNGVRSDPLSGTSLATPFVSGAVLLLHQANPSWSARMLRDILRETGKPINDTTGTKLVFPRLDVLSALKLDWPTENHDFQRTGFTVLQGDMRNPQNVSKTDFVLRENITEEQVVRPSVGEVATRNGEPIELVISAVHDKQGAANDTTLYGVESEAWGPLLLWKRVLKGGAVMSPPTIADVDGDGEKEAVAGVRNGTIYIIESLDGTTAALKWNLSLPLKNVSSIGFPVMDFGGGVAVADIDQNGRRDVVFADHYGNIPDWPAELYMVEYTGSSGSLKYSLTYSNVTNGTGGAFAPVSVADIDDDPQLEIVVPSYYGVHVIDYNASANALQVRCSTNHGRIDGSAVIFDIDRDNEYELIYSTSTYMCAGGKTCKNATYIVNARTCAVERQINYTVVTRVTPSVANLDGDANLEIVVSTGNGTGNLGAIVCYDASTGNENCRFDNSGSFRPGFVSPSIADIDGDGQYDIIAAENNGSQVHIINPVTNTSWNYTFSGVIDSAIAIADVDNDGDFRAEIAVKRAGSPITLLAVRGSSNRPPILSAIRNITALAGSIVDLNASGEVLATDPSGDSVTISFSGPFNSSGHWQTNASDIDSNESWTDYHVLVQASDGSLSDAQYVQVRLFNSSASLQNNFTDGSAKSFRFTGGENQSAIIRLPKNITVLYAALRLEGSK